MNKTIKFKISLEKKAFDKFLKKLLNKNLSKNHLDKVMKYSALNGGKRIRPYLIRQFGTIKKIKPNYYRRLSAAIEIIHSYSLIHDDLPSMDNDDYRRGKLSTHKKFNEAQAILAGDSLHDLAFEILADKKTHINSEIRIMLIQQFSKNLGSYGLAGGQSLDLLYEKKKISLKKIIQMYKMKTGKLFRLCCVCPFIISKASKKEIKFAAEYGELFGLLFQIVDDHIDTVKQKKIIGKTPGKDIKQMKSTISKYFNNYDINIYCKKIIDKFIMKNSLYFKKWPDLKKLLFYLINQLS